MSSTRYKISNRNIYGFKINLPQTILLLPVMMALALLVEFALGPILYPFYQKEAALEENAVGNEAGQDIPVASSIADMETLGAFTLIVKESSSTMTQSAAETKSTIESSCPAAKKSSLTSTKKPSRTPMSLAFTVCPQAPGRSGIPLRKS